MLVDCPPSLGVLTLNALAAASHLVVVTEPSFLALQGIDELLETRDLVRAHYNARLALAGVIVNRVERTVEHRAGLAEIASYFGPDLVWSPQLPKRTVLQDGRGAAARWRSSAAGRRASSAAHSRSSRAGSRCGVWRLSRVRGSARRKPTRPHPASPMEADGARSAAPGVEPERAASSRGW